MSIYIHIETNILYLLAFIYACISYSSCQVKSPWCIAFRWFTRLSGTSFGSRFPKPPPTHTAYTYIYIYTYKTSLWVIRRFWGEGGWGANPQPTDVELSHMLLHTCLMMMMR